MKQEIKELLKTINPLKDSVWCHLINKKGVLDKKTTGKWLIFNDLEYLKDIAGILLPFITSGEIKHIKWSHRELDDPFKKKTPVMCVFSDDSNKEKVWEILKKVGINKKIWKYDSQTREDWGKNGRLTKEWNNSK